MIASFALQPAALRSEATDPACVLAHHDDFIECWTKYGVLVEPSGAERTRLAAAVADLPQPMRVRWEKALQHNLRAPGPESWVGFGGDFTNTLRQLDGQVDLVCLTMADAARAGLPPDSYGFVPTDCRTEVSRMGVVHRSASFTRAKELYEVGEIAQGTPTEELWQTRFAALARFERNVTLVDRYAVDGVLSRGAASGLAVLLHRLNQSSKGCQITIYSGRAAQGEARGGDAVAEVVSRLSDGGLVEAQLYQVADWGRCFDEYLRLLRLRDARIQSAGRLRRENLHDRYLRFGRHVCWIGVGVEAFEGSITPFTSFGRAPFSDALRPWETAMKSTAQRRRCHPNPARAGRRSA